MTNTAIKSWADIGQADRELLAEDISKDGKLVQVQRYGSGNGMHSGIVPGCGVSYITARPNPYASEEAEDEAVDMRSMKYKHLVRDACGRAIWGRNFNISMDELNIKVYGTAR